jgi:DNA-binding protein HU-beta
MNKSDLVAAAAEASGIAKKDVQRVMDAALDIIISRVSQGEKVQLSGFGVFEAKQRNARVGRNPHTRQAIEIPSTRVPDFKPSQNFKVIVGK